MLLANQALRCKEISHDESTIYNTLQIYSLDELAFSLA
jgi:hypothetical protein